MYLLQAYVTNASLNINHPFTYLSDQEVIRFCRIRVIFNRGLNNAIVTDCRYTEKNKEELEKEYGYQLLYINGVIDEEPVISEELYELAEWLSKTTISPFISCLNVMLPKALKTDKKPKNAVTVRKFHKNEGDFNFTKRQQEVYDQLYEGIDAAAARKLSSSIINKLIDLRAIEEYSEEKTFINTEISQTAFKELTPAQEKAYKQILSTDKLVSLLFGVTGSGKTEVYLHLADYYLKRNKDVLILVPEISLTPQMIQRVKERFSDVVFYHSELSDQERYEQYKRVKNKEVRIVVGTRSAIFLPFADLGIIIIDEEHDSSYKQDETPCYHVRNVAIRRAFTHQGKVLLASATPSLDSYSRALKGDYELLQLSERINHCFAQIEVVDLSRQLKKQKEYIISEPLHYELNKVLDNNKQALILLNRRGYSPIIKCGDCLSTIMCQDCDVPLNYHNDEGVLKCHQCGRTYQLIDRCPNCGSKNLVFYGFGTKKVEEEMKKLYPGARIERMDRDNVSRKGAHEQILKRFENKDIDILIGTQMIAKGLDYPDVTLVGILNADAGLMHQDYNAAKLTFDLLMQASGRSGRADDPGKVIIQAFNCDHYAISAVLNQSYVYFYNIEMNYRYKTSYPPYTHIIELLFSDISEEKIIGSCDFIRERLEKLPYRFYRPFPLGKLKKLHRYRILIIDKDLKGMLEDVRNIIDEYIAQRKFSRVKVDIDPLYIE